MSWLVAGVVSLLLGGTGALLGGVAAPRLRRALRARRWPSAAGRILSSRVARIEVSVRTSSGISRARTAQRWIPEVEFAYAVGPQNLVGRQVGLGAPTASEGPEDPAALVARYPVGADVAVRYDPDRPDDAALEVALDAGTLTLAVAALALLGLSGLMPWLLG
jgi:hypothetical protein